MSLLRRYLLFFLCGFVALNFYIARRYDLPYPMPLGPQLDKAVRKNHLQAIEKNKPDIVLIGDSTLTKGVDSIRLAKALNASVYSIDLPGSASTLWYLIIKNNIMEASVLPKYLIIFFRDAMLTAPDYRVQGQYFPQIDEFANDKDGLLIERAFIGRMNMAERLAESYLPVYAARRQARDEFETRLRYLPASFIGYSQTEVDRASAQTFAEDKTNLQALNDAILEAGSNLYSPEALNFNKQADKSFLPELVRMANENNVQLILVRMKTLEFEQPFPALDNYVADLESYARANNAILLDFEHDSRLSPEFYADVLHLNDVGKLAFTDILAETLKPILRFVR